MATTCSACLEPASRRCSGCHRDWYCSKQCQESDWVRHIFDCNPGRDINTADYLALAVRDDLLPEHRQTLIDYGFERAFTADNRTHLFGLFVDLIRFLDVKPQKIHKWRLNGTLVREIHAAYEKVPVSSRGGCYPWFVKNQYVLDDSTPIPDHPSELMHRAWSFIGGSPLDTDGQIEAQIATWPKNKRMCHYLYVVLVGGWHPAPNQELWVYFGFCATRNDYEESGLGGLYRQSIELCTLDEFTAAFESSTLFALMRLKGMHQDTSRSIWNSGWEDLEDVLSGSPDRFKSVWYLKQYIMAKGEVELIPAVVVDYGYMNYKDEEDTSSLTTLYTQIFEKPGMKPLELHQAAIKGELFEYAGRFVPLEKTKFQRLLKNPYPL
jgi:MYND finger